MRGLAISAIAVVLFVIVVVLFLHTNAIQSRVLSWSIGEVERRFDLDLSAEDLHYNLALRRVVLTNVRLAAVGHRDNPFFTANAVSVKLPWAAYRGILRFDDVAVDRGVVTITRDVNDMSNLPPGRGRRDPNAPARRIDVRGLTVAELDFLYRDNRRDVEIRAPGVRTALTYEMGEGAAGPFSIDDGVAVRVRERRVAIEPVQGRMVFDASNVELENVRLNTSEGAFLMRGTIDRALDRPTLNLQFKGTTDLARATKWTTPPVPIQGPATIEATMTGAPSRFVLDAHVASTGAEIGGEQNVSLDAQTRMTPDVITVSRSTITPRTGGEIRATAEVPFGQQSPWWVKAEWRGLDAATAFRLSNVSPWPFGAALAGTARIDRAPGEPFRLELHNVSTPRAARGTAPLEGDVEFFIAGNRWRANQRSRVGATIVEGRIGGIWNRQQAKQSTFEGDLTLRYWRRRRGVGLCRPLRP